MRRPVSILAVLLSLVLFGPGAGLAQEATPVASPAAGVACTVEPRPTDELLALWFGPEGTPLAAPPVASPVAGEVALPEGEAADAETVAAVTATLQELNACFEANQFARAFALMTDNVVRQFGPTSGEPLEQVRALLEAQEAQPVATPEPDGGQTVVPPLRDVRVLDDGRVGGILEEEGPLVFLIFERQDGRWLIADFLEIRSADGTSAVGTPAAEATPT